MSYLPLPEAAEYLQHRTGVEITDASVLRMGVLGHLLIVGYFDGVMRNLTAHGNEEIVGHLVIPPRHLAAIENDGEAIIVGASSLDGRAFYSPQVQRTRAQLRVLTSELDRIAPFIHASPGHQPLPANEQHKPARVALKAERQDVAILEWIGKAGHDPKNLPERPKNGGGVKSQVSEAMLKDVALFTESSFKHAWDRLRNRKDIQGGE